MNLQVTIEKLLAPLKRRIQMMIARGLVTLVTDGKKVQRLQVSLLADEALDDIERIGQFGFTSVPKSGAEVVVVFLGGSRDHGVAVAVDDRRYRPTDLLEGESAVYSFGKYQLRVKNDKLQIGKNGTWETAVVGETLAELLGHLIDDLAQHTHAAPGAPPSTATAITARKTGYITNGKILAKDGGRFS